MRHERYAIGADIWYRACASQVRTCELWAAAARDGVDAVGAGTPAGERLDNMGRFFGFVGRDMARAAEHWRHVFASEVVTGPG
ncbi:hypothetical protein [Pseudonocardia sp. GCM10023141]|uniref:hypothetical protein n=1 Tax=Pseudonocardia sp. GCM10023141 TaxID=3252653 RepID=UPI003615B02D